MDRATPHSQGSLALGILRLMRPYQWVKNLLVFVPLLLSHRAGDLERAWAAAGAFIIFCLASSAAYILNDRRDLDADRDHPIKRFRPMASGAVPVRLALPLAAALLVAAFALSATLLPLPFIVALATYVVTTILYTIWLKSRLLLDVLVLAGLYTLRLIAGGTATDVDLTPWLLAFSMFLFLSLAFAKRHAELANAREDAAHLKARGYRHEDIGLVESVGATSGYMAVLVLAIYINSPLATQLYRHPMLLWLVCPILLYWITRIWFLARRRRLNEDPILFALRDRVSWIAGALAIAIVLLAILLPA